MKKVTPRPARKILAEQRREPKVGDFPAVIQPRNSDKNEYIRLIKKELNQKIKINPEYTDSLDVAIALYNMAMDKIEAESDQFTSTPSRDKLIRKDGEEAKDGISPIFPRK